MASTVARVLVAVSSLVATSIGPLVGQQPGASKIGDFRFQGTTLSGRKLDQEALRGQVVIVDLWGTWCPPCRQAIPVLVGLHQKYKQYGLEVVGFGFAADGSAEDQDTERSFAADQHITYELLPGDPAVRNQVPDFRGYPTMLVFDRSWHLVDSHVGFDEELQSRLDKVVRTALGLDKTGDATAENQEEAKEEVPPGRLFVPGNGDRGLELTVVTVAGEEVRLESLRDAPCLLAITTSWDQEAERTSGLLQHLHELHPRAHVLAWHVERAAEQGERDAAVRAFVGARGAGYQAFATGLKEARAKIHRFASLPTLLLLDSQGILIARENGISEAIEQRIAARFAAACAEAPR